MQAVIATGQGRYADPWHPYAATSGRLETVLAEAGFNVVIDPDLDGAMTRLDGVDLLVVNAGDPWRGTGDPPPPPEESIGGFRTALHRGIGVLALHAAAATMRDYPEWAGAVGAIWLPTISGHPPIDTARITITTARLGADLVDFDVHDERYSRLQLLGRSDIVATHTVDGMVHPTAWTRLVGPSRVAVDLLGHDERSYDSAGHRRLLTELARWVVGSTVVAQATELGGIGTSSPPT